MDYPEKSPYWAALDAWGISQQEYIDTPVSELFSEVEGNIYKSKSKAPDSGIIIFCRGNKFGYSVAVWNSIGDGVKWTPCVQATIFENAELAKEAAIAKFLEYAKNNVLIRWANRLRHGPRKPQKPQQMSLF